MRKTHKSQGFVDELGAVLTARRERFLTVFKKSF